MNKNQRQKHMSQAEKRKFNELLMNVYLCIFNVYNSYYTISLPSSSSRKKTKTNKLSCLIILSNLFFPSKIRFGRFLCQLPLYIRSWGCCFAKTDADSQLFEAAIVVYSRFTRCFCVVSSRFCLCDNTLIPPLFKEIYSPLSLVMAFLVEDCI